MKFKVFISSVQCEFAAEQRKLKTAYASWVSVGQKTAVRDLADWEQTGVVDSRGKARGRYLVLHANVDTNRITRTSDSLRVEFVCSGSSSEAHGFTGLGKPFVVRRGAVVSPSTMPSLKTRTPGYCRLRNRLEEDETIVNGVFTRDYGFASPSAASSVVTGRPSNGRIDWIAADDRSLKEVQEGWPT